MINLLNGDCLEQMKGLDDNSVDSIVTDPPYGISFMAKKWDYDVPSVEVWKEAMRVLKPGGHALIACGTRTQHRMVVNIEDAGFEIRDVVSWIYGSGFPKSLNISKAIDKAAGAEREVISGTPNPEKYFDSRSSSDRPKTEGAITDAAKQWDGWGTALKPSCEFFTLCRKPLSEKTIAANVLKWGTGGINIDGCRVELDGDYKSKPNGRPSQTGLGDNYNPSEANQPDTQGRFPANLIHDGSQEVLELFPETKSGKLQQHHKRGEQVNAYGKSNGASPSKDFGGDKGSAARFFYCPKASKKDRNEGCEEFVRGTGGIPVKSPFMGKINEAPKSNTHPTVKPTALMAYLCRLITPTGGTVLDPYMGSGSTGKAAVSEGFSFTGIELDPDYYEICKERVKRF